MKKLFSLLICFIITAGLFTACSDKKAEPAAESSAQTSVETETKTEPKTDIGSTESEQTSKPDNQSPANPAESVIKLAQRQVTNWTINEINDCVYKAEYDEDSGVMIINAIFINENEANPNQKAADVEKFIIDKIRLTDLQSIDPNFHLGIIIADRKGNILLSSVDGTPK